MIEGARWRTWVFFYAPMALFLVFLLFPFYWMLITSVRPDGELYRPWNSINYNPFWTWKPTLDHVRYLFEETLFPSWLLNTTFIALASTAISLVCGVFAGYALSRLNFPFAGSLGTAIFITYDDSDGWYDHVYPPIANASALNGLPASSDQLTGPGQCGVPLAGAVMGRCGYGPRMPFLVISPNARRNYVDHTVTDQTSVLRFIEDNFNLGRIDQASPKSVAEGGSFDQIAGSLGSLFEFDRDDDGRRGDRDDRDDRRLLILDPDTGQPVRRY